MPHDYQVLARHQRFHGRVIDVVSDEVRMPGGRTGMRDYVKHPGSVAILALDDEDRVLMIRQYRHPLRETLWELPAGLLDVDDERPDAAATRELAEEGFITARRWDTLVDTCSSPGMSDEVVRTYLARDLATVPDAERYQAAGDEEVELERHWVRLDDAVAMVLRSEVLNGPCQVSVLAAAAGRSAGWATLRPLDAAWPRAGERE